MHGDVKISDLTIVNSPCWVESLLRWRKVLCKDWKLLARPGRKSNIHRPPVASVHCKVCCTEFDWTCTKLLNRTNCALQWYWMHWIEVQWSVHSALDPHQAKHHLGSQEEAIVAKHHRCMKVKHYKCVQKVDGRKQSARCKMGVWWSQFADTLTPAISSSTKFWQNFYFQAFTQPFRRLHSNYNTEKILKIYHTWTKLVYWGSKRRSIHQVLF